MSKVYHLKKQISDVLKDEYSFKFCREAMVVAAGVSDVEVKVGELYAKKTATRYVSQSAEKPAIYVVSLSKNGTSTADQTLIVGGVTFTAKASPATTSGTTEYALTATAAEIATIIAAKGLTNYTVTASEGVLTYTQTTPGTGSAVSLGSGTDATVDATLVTTQTYAAATTSNLSSMDCICLENKIIPAGETASVLVLVRGPAMYDVDNLEIPESDKTAVKTQLLNFWMVAAQQPPVTVTQET